MRPIVACDHCSHQYDTTGHAPGTRFRCNCGATIEIKEAAAHDAAVVRCSSCGGPRGADNTCEFCGSSFTLHERDLNTICPSCMSRISDKASFCHSCGTAIAADSAGSEVDSACPACSDKPNLFSREVGSERLAVLECPQCAGLWVGTDTFRHLEDRARTRTVDSVTSSVEKSTPETLKREAGASIYRPCIVCGKLMNRQNYGRRSGVIIDSCREHGVWFDNDELAQILAWIREGGLGQSQAMDHENRKVELREAMLKAGREKDKEYGSTYKHSVRPRTGADVLGAILGGLFD